MAAIALIVNFYLWLFAIAMFAPLLYLLGLMIVAPFKAMHEHYPDDYAKAVAGINAAKVKDQAAVTAAARPVLSAIVSRQIKKVDEANMMRLMALAVREGSALRDAKPASCVSLFTGAASTEDYSKSMPQALVQEDLETSAAILTQTATKPAGPATPIDPKVMGDLSVKVLGMLPEDERTAILPLLSASKPPSSEVEMRGMCDFYIALFSTALSEPEPGKTLRAMVAAGA